MARVWHILPRPRAVAVAAKAEREKRRDEKTHTHEQANKRTKQTKRPHWCEEHQARPHQNTPSPSTLRGKKKKIIPAITVQRRTEAAELKQVNLKQARVPLAELASSMSTIGRKKKTTAENLLSQHLHPAKKQSCRPPQPQPPPPPPPSLRTKPQ